MISSLSDVSFPLIFSGKIPAVSTSVSPVEINNDKARTKTADLDRVVAWQEIRALNEMVAVVDFSEASGESPSFSRYKLWDEISRIFPILSKEQSLQPEFDPIKLRPSELFGNAHDPSYLSQKVDTLLNG